MEDPQPTAGAEAGTSTPTPPSLDGQQRKQLRALAHHLQPVVQVGHGGVSQQVIGAVDAALWTHELIKVRLHEPQDKRGMAEALATGTGAVMCGMVGHTVILYRPNPEKPRIVV